MPEIATEVSLAPYTTFKIGGLADHFAVARSLLELQELVAFANAKHWPLLILGGGSNVLISDDGFRGLVVKLELAGIIYDAQADTTLVSAKAGVVFDDLIKETIERNLWGLENLSHIPGSVGATPVQNVGAYGVEVGNLITAVTTLDKEKNTLKVFSNEQCRFDYRDSFFKTAAGQKFIIVSVTFALSNIPQPRLEYKDLKNFFSGAAVCDIQAVREAVISIRRQKFPDWKQVGTAGSFFKNPILMKDHYNTLRHSYPELPGYAMSDREVKVPLGWILDKVCDLKGYQAGKVGTYHGQSLVLVNHGGATFAEVKNFAALIAEKVFAATKIKIEWEVTMV